jgi:hypothetical protein
MVKAVLRLESPGAMGRFPRFDLFVLFVQPLGPLLGPLVPPEASGGVASPGRRFP